MNDRGGARSRPAGYGYGVRPDSDTSPEMVERLVALYRSMTPSEKLRKVAELNAMTWHLAMARQRQWYPDADERAVRMRLLSLWVDRESMIRQFGWDPEQMGR